MSALVMYLVVYLSDQGKAESQLPLAATTSLYIHPRKVNALMQAFIILLICLSYVSYHY